MVLQVNPSVLIPRPETELLVDLVLDECKQYDTSIHILDMCSGSGAIAIALAKNCNRVVVDAVDISLNAVELAKRNVRFQNVGSSVNVFQSDCFVNVNKRYNVIVANPPYIPSDQLKDLPDDVRQEPEIALDGGTNGVDFIRRMVVGSVKYLCRGGLLLFEISGDFQKERMYRYTRG